MVKVVENLQGKRFSRLIVLKQVDDHVDPNGRRRPQWLCQCDCGSDPIIVLGDSLKGGHTKSCGCLRDEKAKITLLKHGDSYTKLYSVYQSIIDRCYNINNKRFNDYGGRGIDVCDEWKNNYIAFKEWAISNGYQEGLSIDRIDNDTGYSSSNCRWVTRKTQQNNTRFNHIVEYNNESKTIAEWSEITGIKYDTLYGRLYRGWTAEKALTTPV